MSSGSGGGGAATVGGMGCRGKVEEEAT